MSLFCLTHCDIILTNSTRNWYFTTCNIEIKFSCTFFSFFIAVDVEYKAGVIALPWRWLISDGGHNIKVVADYEIQNTRILSRTSPGRFSTGWFMYVFWRQSKKAVSATEVDMLSCQETAPWLKSQVMTPDYPHKPCVDISPAETMVQLCLVVQGGWDDIPRARITHLSPFMPQRCRIVHEAHGLSQPSLTLLHLTVR